MKIEIYPLLTPKGVRYRVRKKCFLFDSKILYDHGDFIDINDKLESLKMAIIDKSPLDFISVKDAEREVKYLFGAKQKIHYWSA